MTTLYYATDDPTRFPALRLDLIDKLRHRETALITDLPLESGRNVADNAVAEPRTFDLSATVSNVPSVRLDDFGQPVLDDNGDPIYERNRPAELWGLLRSIKDETRFVTIVDELGTYEQCLIEDLDRLQDFHTGTSLQVRITIREIRFIDVQFSALTRAVVVTTPEAEQTFQIDTEGVFDPEPAENKTSTVDAGALQTVESPVYYDFNDFNFGNQTNVPILNQ